jgi:hypothetical protein
MTIVTSMENRNAERDVWPSPRQACMAHRSQVSPDGKWVLVVWIGADSDWRSCQLVPFEGCSGRDRLDQRPRPALRPHDLRMGAGCISVRLPGEDSILLREGGHRCVFLARNFDRATRLRSDAREQRQQNRNSACVHIASLPGQSEINLHISGSVVARTRNLDLLGSCFLTGLTAVFVATLHQAPAG